ncbi:MAG: hypothetical protein JRH08_00745 [Deltaproteobacteria bacterium]|nr:hypothetical protein [Deltaproteobacteria bacterium]MBW2124231.1 hypothetical protein [Deltaproteobacteria bacterium]
MLSKKDKEEIRQMIQEELKAALFRKITIERGPRKQGDPEKVIKEEEWNVLDFLAAYLPRIEAAMRGMQEDLDHTKNKVETYNRKLEAVAQTLLGMEKAAKKVALLSDMIAERQRLLQIPGYQMGHEVLKNESSG